VNHSHHIHFYNAQVSFVASDPDLGLDPNDEFEAILLEILQMHRKKSKDYGSNEDPYANVSASREFGVQPWVGALIRENDKTTRIKSFIKKRALANESLEDSLIDKAVYSIIALLLYRRSEQE